MIWSNVSAASFNEVPFSSASQDPIRVTYIVILQDLFTITVLACYLKSACVPTGYQTTAEWLQAGWSVAKARGYHDRPDCGWRWWLSAGLGTPDPGGDWKGLSPRLCYFGCSCDKLDLSIIAFSYLGRQRPNHWLHTVLCMHVCVCVYACVWVCVCFCPCRHACWHPTPCVLNQAMHPASSLQTCYSREAMGLVPIATQSCSLHSSLASQTGKKTAKNMFTANEWFIFSLYAD